MNDDVIKRLFARKVEGLHRVVDMMPTGISKAVQRAKVRRLEDVVRSYDRSTDPETRLAGLRACHTMKDDLNRIVFTRLSKEVC